MAAHASEWGNSLNPRCRRGKWLTMVVMFVGCPVLGDDPNIVLFLPYKTCRAGVFVSAQTKIVVKLSIDLLLALPYKCITATTTVTFPVFAFSRAFTSALLLFEMGLVTLIGRGWVDCKSDIKGLSNVRCLSTTYSMSRDQISYLELESLLEESYALLCLHFLPFIAFFSPFFTRVSTAADR